MTLIYGGLGTIAPRSQRHFKESDKMEDLYLFFKKKASFFVLLNAYVVKLEKNYIDVWGSGGCRPQKPATSQRIR